MKTLTRSVLFAAALAAAFLVGNARADVETGKPAPDFSLTDTAGKTHKLSEYKGKVVVLEWINPGCPVVLRHYRSGNMQSTQEAAKADGAVWLSVFSNQPGAQGDMPDKDTNAWLKKHNSASQAYLKDPSGKVGKLYGAKATPHMYVVDKSGVLVYKGAIDDSPSAKEADTMKAKNYVKAALVSLKEGKPIEKAATQAYGCGIKYAKSDT